MMNEPTNQEKFQIIPINHPNRQLTWSNAEKSAKPSGELSLLAAPGGGGRDGPAPPGGGGRLGGGGRRGGAALFFGGRAGVGESEGNPLRIV